MTDMLDPVELLNSMSPPAGWNDPTDLATDERAASILERVVNGNVIPFRPPRRRLRIATGVVVALAVGGAGVAALLQRSVDEDRVVRCWSEPAAAQRAEILLSWDGETDPAELCTQEWQGGRLGTTGPPAPLQLCVTGEGVVAVIPGDDGICAALDFGVFVAPEPGEPTPEDDETQDANALQRMLERRYNRGSCFTEQEALEGVRRTLDEYKFDGWAVQSRGTFSAEEPCASIAVDKELETVVITALGPSAEAPN